MREGVKLNFILERKDKKEFLPSEKWLPQPLLSSVAAFPLDQQHLPSACEGFQCGKGRSHPWEGAPCLFSSNME